MKKLKLGTYLISVLAIALIVISTYKVLIKNNDLTIYGSIKYADGLGRQPIDLINMLEGEKVDINFIGEIKSTKNISDRVQSVLRNFNFKIGHIFINEEPLHFKEQTYKFDSPIYQVLAKINGLLRSKQIWIAYSMFESNKISPIWVKELNNKYDMVVVPDASLVEIYKKSGVNTPIFVVPLSVDFKGALSQELKKESHPIFTFANFSTIEDRKNTLKVLEVFKEAFGNRKDVRLLISSRKSEYRYKQKVVDYIIKNNLTNVDYEIVEKDADLYNKYFDKVDCYVSLSKGEGFSVQPREAMARGIPVIISDGLAQKTIANSGLVRVVPAKILELASYEDGNIIMGHHFNSSTKDAVLAFKDVYNNYNKYLKLAPKAREWARQYDYQNVKPLYINMVKPKKIILGQKNEITDEYLITNSEALYNKYISLYK